MFLVLTVFEHGMWQDHCHADFDLGLCVCVYFYNSLQVIIYTFNYEKGVQGTDMHDISYLKNNLSKISIIETSSELKKPRISQISHFSILARFSQRS